MIEFEDVSKTFDDGQSYVVNHLNLTVRRGETLVLLGSSGCGKTTTLKMMNGLIKSSDGEIILDGQPIRTIDPVRLKRSIGYAFQGVGLFPHLTVTENIAIVLRLNGESYQEQQKTAKDMMVLVNLDPGLGDRYPDELSGGQQQRVGVARALANDPDYLLMDEPFGALDPINRDLLQAELIKIKEELNKTIVFVTHDIVEALRVADRIAIMHRGQIEQIGRAREFIDRPQTSFVEAFFQRPIQQINEYVTR